MNSSQESSSSQELFLGPLSQETLTRTLNAIPKEIFDEFMKTNFDANLSSMEGIVEDSEMSDPKELEEHVVSLQASIPVTENLPGCYNFTVHAAPDDVSKKCRYTFSPEMNKLYVRMNALCPFSFSTSEVLEGFSIRAMLYFASLENRSIVVDRCLYHIKQDSEIDDPHFEHFIRAENQSASYYKDYSTNRMSVTVKFQNPAFGERYSTYLYKFMCYTSCVGGPNRRPMCIVFTLEKNGRPFGRCKVDIKVCSDPKRDRLMDEKSLRKKIPVPLNSNKTSQPMSSVMNSSFNKERANKSKEECLTIKISDKEEYNYLRSVQKLYHMDRLMKSYNWAQSEPDLKKFKKIFSSSSHESE